MTQKSSSFSLDRLENIRRIEQTDHWDLIVVGGGATGLGTALDAVSRDFNVLLLEQDDFCKATSSRSTKLIHGGVRYLEQAELGLVRSALRERGQLLTNAPHVVTEAEFILPSQNLLQRIYYGMGLKIYDLLSSGRHRLGSSRLLSNQQIQEKMPNLKTQKFSGGVCYRDAQFDDARLGIQLAQTIEKHGGTVVNSVRVTDLLRNHNQIAGVEAEDRRSGKRYELSADVVINATGIFTDSIRSMDEPESEPLLTHSRGSHLVVDQEFLTGSSAMVIPKTDDGRVLFAIPWKNRTVIGTTDVPVDQPRLEPTPTPDEIDYMLKHIGRYLDKSPERDDILSVFAGLRPLVSAGSSNTSAISRDHHIEITNSGLITVTGGKWTTFREMGEDAVSHAIDHGPLPEVASRSSQIKIHGYTEEQSTEQNLSEWGSDGQRIRKFLQGNPPEYQEKLHPSFPYPRGLITWCTRHEMARGIEDILARRTRCLFMDARATLECVEDVVELMAEERNYSREWKQNQIEEFTDLAQNYLPN